MAKEYVGGCWVYGGDARVCEMGTKGCRREHPLRCQAVPCTCIGDVWHPDCPANLSHPKQETPLEASARKVSERATADWMARVSKGEDTYPTPHPIPRIDIVETGRIPSGGPNQVQELYRAAHAMIQADIAATMAYAERFTLDLEWDTFPGLGTVYPKDMTRRERLIRRLMRSAITPGALVHYMGAYAGAVP